MDLWTFDRRVMNGVCIYSGVLHVVDTSTVYEEEEESFKDIVFVIGVCGGCV